MNFYCEVPPWPWSIYWIPMLCCLPISIATILDDGYLTLGEAIEMTVKTFTPLVNIVMLILVLKEFMPSRHHVIWRRKAQGARSRQ